MQNTLPTIDTNRLLPYTIGFDDLFDRLFDLNYESSGHGYPPYNIVKLDDNHYQIEMALAGFGKKDIELKYADNQLTIKSVEDKDKKEKDTIHRGISKRQFSRSFTLAEDIKVNGAELKDGMLLIELEKIVPEEKQPRTISIK